MHKRVLEQLQNAANGVCSKGPEVCDNIKQVDIEKGRVEVQSPMQGLPSMSHEQLALAQSNW